MRTPSQDASGCEGNQSINMLAKLQKTTSLVDFKHKHLFNKQVKGGEEKKQHLVKTGYVQPTSKRCIHIKYV